MIRNATMTPYKRKKFDSFKTRPKVKVIVEYSLDSDDLKKPTLYKQSLYFSDVEMAKWCIESMNKTGKMPPIDQQKDWDEKGRKSITAQNWMSRQN